MAGQLRVDEITNEAGTGAPSFPNKIAPASLGTGTPSAANFLRGDGAWDSPAGALQLLREDIITTSGNWTVASGFDANDTVMIFLFGGGGGGRATRVSAGAPHGAAGGGSGAAGVIITTRYGDVPTSTFTLTVGAGGAAATAATDGSTAANNGNNTTLVNSTINMTITCGGGFSGPGQVASSTLDNRNLGGQAIRLVQITNKFHSRSVSNIGSSPDVGLKDAGLGVYAASYYGNGYDTSVDNIAFSNPVHAIVGGGGSAARQGATDRPAYNAVLPGIVGTGGAGSGTANGANGTGIGSGGGGSCRPAGTTATSGAGAPGGMVVRYYRGAVSPFQILGR